MKIFKLAIIFLILVSAKSKCILFKSPKKTYQIKQDVFRLNNIYMHRIHGCVSVYKNNVIAIGNIYRKSLSSTIANYLDQLVKDLGTNLNKVLPNKLENVKEGIINNLSTKISSFDSYLASEFSSTDKKDILERIKIINNTISVFEKQKLKLKKLYDTLEDKSNPEIDKAIKSFVN